MHERDLEAEHPAPRRGVDQLRAAGSELCERRADVVHLVGDVMHPRTPLGEEAADRRVVAERREELDATVADAHGRRLDPLVLDARTVLEPASEEPLVRLDGLVEIGDRDANVMDPPRLHDRDVSVSRRWRGG